MIQIDDAGSGSLVGGTCIGAVRVETGDFRFDFVPIEYYRRPYFQTKCYLKKTTEIVLDLLNILNVDHDETIEICQGYMFDHTRHVLSERYSTVVSKNIENPLQDMIESTFEDYAIDLGVPIQYVKYTKYPLHFHRILRWVYADYINRAYLCKTGWKSWKRYGNLKPDIQYGIATEDNYICLKCGKAILINSKVKILKYVSNCKNIIYLHLEC